MFWERESVNPAAGPVFAPLCLEKKEPYKNTSNRHVHVSEQNCPKQTLWRFHPLVGPVLIPVLLLCWCSFRALSSTPPVTAHLLVSRLRSHKYNCKEGKFSHVINVIDLIHLLKLQRLKKGEIIFLCHFFIYKPLPANTSRCRCFTKNKLIENFWSHFLPL